MNKNNKGLTTIIILLIVVALTGGGSATYKIMQKSGFIKSNGKSDILQPVVGGDRDLHGCIPSAGYSWCEVKQKCLRIWEEKCDVATTTSIVDTKDWKTYVNEEYGFEFKYPKGWEVLQRNKGMVQIGNPLSGLRVFHLSVSIEDNPNQLSAKSYAENFVKNRLAEIERDGVGVVRYDQEFETKVGAFNAYEFKNYFNFDQHSERIYVTQNTHAFVFEFPVAEENPNLNKPIENNAVSHQILSTFKLTGTPQLFQKPCIITGCSSHICADGPIISTCKYLPKYACYKTAKCERQEDGRCGWTGSPTLSQCLKNGGLTE